MAGNVVEIVVKASDDTGPGFASAKAKSGEAAAGFDELAAAQDKVTAAENKLREAQIAQTDAQLRLEELQQSGQASADELAAAQDKVTRATIRTADAQIRLGEADARLAMAEKGAGDAAQAQAAKTDEAAGAAARGGKEFTLFGGGAALALGAVGYESLKMSMSFQQAMERLVTQAGVPQKELGSLKAGVLSLAGSVGFDPNSLATSLYHVASNMASLGATGPQMLNAVKIAAEGAKVGGASLEDVTNALTAAIASGIPGVENYSKAMGALNAIVGAGDMSMQQLAEAMGTGLLAVVKGFGLSLKDVGAALATFGDNNIRGADAATQLRMAVEFLAKPAATGKKELEGMGMSMTTLARDMQTGGLMKALDDLQSHFEKTGIVSHVTAAKLKADIKEYGVNSQQVTKDLGSEGEALVNIFGKKAGVGIAIMMEQMDRLKSKYPDLTKGANDFGKAWAETGQTLSQQWAQIRGQFDAMLVQLGEKLIPVLSAVAGFLERNQGIIKSLAPVVMAVVGAFAALKLVMAGISMVTSLGPWGIALMAVAAATVLVIEHFNAVKHAVAEVFDWIKSHWLLLTPLLATPLGPILALGLGIYQLVKHFKTVEDAAKSAARAVGEAWSDVWNAVVGPVIRAFSEVKNAITGGFDGWWKSHGEQVKEVWNAIWGPMKAVFKAFWDVNVAILKTSWDEISAVFKASAAVISAIWKVLWDDLSMVFKMAWGVITGALKVSLAFIKADINASWDFVVGTFNVFLDLITGKWGKAWKDLQAMVVQVWNAIRSFLSGAWSAITSAAQSTWNALVNGVKRMTSDVLSFFQALPGKIIAALSSLGSMLFNAGVHAMESLISGIESMLGHLASTMGNIASKIAGFIGLSPAKEGPLSGGGAPEIRGRHIAEDIARGMLSGHDAVTAAAAQLAGTAAAAAGFGRPGAYYGGTANNSGISVIRIEPTAGGSGLDQLFWTWLRNGIRAKGGNVQVVLGHG